MKTEVNLLKIPQEQVKSESNGRTTGIVAALLLFLCVISVAFYTYQKSLNQSASPKDLLHLFRGTGSRVVKEAQIKYSFNFDSREKPVFVAYSYYIVKCSSGEIWFLDREGEVVWSESITFKNPILKTNGSQLLAADIGAGELFLMEDRSIRWRDKLDSSILNADISEDGYVTVITSSKRDNNEIRVYDPQGVELFRKIIANDFAVSAYIAPSEKILAVSGISTGAVGAYSNYKFYDLEGKDLGRQSFDVLGELLPIFWYNHDDSLFAVGDRAAALLDKTGKLIWVEQFKSIAGAGPVRSKRFALVAESNEGTQLMLYTTSGQKLSSCSLQGKPKGMAAINGTIAVYTYDMVYFYNDKCKNIGKYSAGSNIKQIYFLDRQQAAVITDSTVTVININ